MSIGKQLLHLRKINGLSQEDVAEIFNVSRQTVSKWESDLSYPNMETVIKMSEYYKVSLNYILEINQEDKDDQTNQLLEQIDLLNQNIKKGNKKHMIIESILAICLVISLISVTYLMRHPKIINNTSVINNDSHPFDWDWETLKIDIDNMMITKSIVCSFKKYNKEDKVQLVLNTQDKDYYYDINYQKDGIFANQIDIPLTEIEKSYIIINDSEKYENIYNDDMNMETLLFDSIDLCIKSEVPNENKYMLDQLFYNIKLDHYNYPIVGSLKGELNVKIGTSFTDGDINWDVLDTSIDVSKPTTLKLQQDIKYLKDYHILITAKIETNGIYKEYDVCNDSFKYIQSPYFIRNEINILNK